MLFAGAAQAQDADLTQAVEADYRANLAALFEHFHRNPELSGVEVQTAARMAQELRALGFDVTENVGGPGVVAVLRNGEGPTVLMRADMDGLPVAEDSGLSYASTARQVDRYGVEQPVMHACGHDVHITALIGAARQMTRLKDQWSGTLILIAQPSEESVSGAKAMIDDGLYTRFPKPDYALAFHVISGIPAGRVEVPLTVVSSSADAVDIRVRGIAAHGASPHEGVDPVYVAAQIVTSLQSIPSRSIDPLQGAIITVGSIHGGTKHNVIPDHVDLQLTVRSDDPAVRDQLIAGIRRVASGTASALGVPENLLPIVNVREDEVTPPTHNDTPTAQRVRDAITARLGPDILIDLPRTGMGAEDFSYLVTPDTGVKGVYFSVGGTPPDQMGNAPSHHSPLFRIDPEPSVTRGVEAMVTAGMALMPRE